MPDNGATKSLQLTQEGFEELKAELAELTDTKRPAAIDRVALARSYGDLKENSEYHSAKEDLEFIENRISDIEDVLEHATVIKNTKSKTTVGVGSLVEVKTDKGKKKTFHIVGDFEADPAEGKISGSSPIGAALMGKKAGAKVEVKVPAGTMTYTIEKIQ